MDFRFNFGRPQRLAALILLFFFAESLYLIGRTPLSDTEYRYALCGREMWERPVPTAGYFTTCGNMQGDGTLAYRIAALPLTLYVQALSLGDRIDAKRHGQTYEANPTTGSVYDLRHQIIGTRYLLRVPFALVGVLLGAGLWWVSRRLFGNIPGAFALGLYSLSPVVLRYSTTPNNEILAAWGMFAVVYTAVGIAHAMYGPPRKWRPRIVLYTVALGLTACAHILAAVLGVLFSALYMLYIAERRRTLVFPILIVASFGAMLMVFASYVFHLSLFTYVFTAGAALFTFDYHPAQELLRDPMQLAATASIAVGLVLYVAMKRARYFGNTVPLLTSLALLPIATTQVQSVPTLWAYPFLLTFASGVLADASETQHRKLYLAFMLTALLAQAICCGTWMFVVNR